MIYTITLNPAFDLHYEMDEFVPFSENYVKKAKKSPGGKGINVSKALSVMGVSNKAYVVLGKENGDEFLNGLKDIDIEPFYEEGRIRENITIHPEKGKETRISLDNFSLSEKVLENVEKTLFSNLKEDDFVIFAGRIPKGIEKERILTFLSAVKAKRARLVLDSNSLNVYDILNLKPYLIKPNEEEIKALAENLSFEEFSKKLNNEGVENVMISLGAEGIFYSGSKESFSVKAPKIKVISTIGAGDSAIAGFVAGCDRGYSKKDRVSLSVASGSAACLSEGTNPPKKEDIERLFKSL